MANAEEDKRLLNQANSTLAELAHPAGLSVAVASSRSATVYFQEGYADISNDQRVHQSNVFGIGSITKVFVAVVVFQLAQEGKLNLTDNVEQFLATEVTQDIDGASEATLLQLLGHTSGIDSWEDDPEWIRDGRGKDVRLDHIWGKTEPLNYLRRPRRTAPEPGTWSYSNTNYTLLGLIVEKVTNTTAESEIRRRILQPLKLMHTYMEGFEQPGDGNLPCRYHLATHEFRATAGVCPAFPDLGDDLIEARSYNMSVSWTAGGMISSPQDLCTFAIALRDGKLINSESMKILQKWRMAGPSLTCGHGLFRMDLPVTGQWRGHSGGVLGFSAGLWWHEERDCVMAILGNLGTVHSGSITRSVKAVVTKSDFPEFALELVS